MLVSHREAYVSRVPRLSDPERIQVPPHAPIAFPLYHLCDHLYDPGASRPDGLDVIRILLDPYFLGVVKPLAFLVIGCRER